MSIHITNYKNGTVNYTRDNIPSEMVITEAMLKEVFPGVEKTYPMILSLIDEQLVMIIEAYHSISNHVARDYTSREVNLTYRGI